MRSCGCGRVSYGDALTSHDLQQEKAYENFKEGFNVLSAIIDEKGVGGKAGNFEDNPTNADSVLVAQFIWLDKYGAEGAWNRVKKWNDSKWDCT